MRSIWCNTVSQMLPGQQVRQHLEQLQVKQQLITREIFNFLSDISFSEFEIINFTAQVSA